MFKSQYISTYRVLRKGIITVTTPSVLSLILLVTASVFLIANDYNAGGILIILSFIIFFILFQHLHLNWYIWAVKYVDDIPQFLKAGEIYQLTRYEQFPRIRTIFPYKKKKNEIEHIVLERKEKNLLIVELDNNPHLSGYYVYNSIFLGLFGLLIGLSCSYLVWFFIDEPSEYSLIYTIFLIILFSLFAFIGFWGFILSLNREPFLSICKEGVMIKKTVSRDNKLIRNCNLKWNEIENIEVEKRLEGFGKSRSTNKYLKITHKEKNGTLNTMEISLVGLNTTIVKLDEAIKTYKKYNKDIT